MIVLGWTCLVLSLLVQATVWFGGASAGGSWESTALTGPMVRTGLAVLLAGTGVFVLWRARRRPPRLLSPEDDQRVVDAIGQFERHTSGEIRVHVTQDGGTDILATAARTFEKLGMTETAERNGVLFFVDVKRRRFAVLGDEGIDQRVPDGFWDDVLAHVRECFARGEYATGLIEGIQMAGAALAEHFPRRDDDVNELPDQITRD